MPKATIHENRNTQYWECNIDGPTYGYAIVPPSESEAPVQAHKPGSPTGWDVDPLARIGWALGVGRLAGITCPVVGGALLAFGLPSTEILLFACGFGVVTATLVTLRGFHRRGLPGAA